MTPKEKAWEIVLKYRLIEFDKTENTRLMISLKDAKECALIAVDEIIEATSMYQYGINNALEHIPSKIVKHPYWQDVKQEIELL